MSKKEHRESPGGRSQLSLCRRCPRQWAWKYLRGFKSTELVNYLVHGSAVHEAQEAYYLNFNLGLEGATEAMWDRMYEFFDEQDPEKKHKDFYKTQLERTKVTLGVWYDMIGQYDIDKVNVIFVEEEAPLTLYNGYQMSVRFDRVLEDKETGYIFINDTKTTGSSLASTLNNYVYDDQPILYQAAFKQNYPDLVDRLEGWRTDGIYSKRLVSGNYSKDARRSEVTLTTEARIHDAIVSYTRLTDQIADRIKLVQDGVAKSLAFEPSLGSCLDYNRVCGYYNFCHKIDEIDGPPMNMEIDPWLGERVVLGSFDELVEAL